MVTYFNDDGTLVGRHVHCGASSRGVACVQISLSRVESSSKIWVDQSTCRRLGDNWALGVIIINNI
jgi:hypothetical protein